MRLKIEVDLTFDEAEALIDDHHGMYTDLDMAWAAWSKIEEAVVQAIFTERGME